MSKSRAFQLGAATLAAAGVLSACSGGSGGGGGTFTAPTPTSGAVPSSSASGSGGEAPSVPSPLPTDAITSNPCQALATDQVTQIGLTGPGTQQSSPAGPDCKWKSATSQFNVVYIGLITANKNGLSDIYAGKATNKYFEPTTINGYPGVYADITDNRSGGDCQLLVGVTDQLAVSVSAQIGSGPNKSNPCPVVERVAKAMIQHLQGS